jgi:hypothetical protein
MGHIERQEEHMDLEAARQIVSFLVLSFCD